MPIERQRRNESLEVLLDRILQRESSSLAKDPIRISLLALAAVCIIAGIVMVYLGIRAEGVIDIASSVVKGKIQTGSAGLFFSFIGMVLAVVGGLKRFKKVSKVVLRTKDGEVIGIEVLSIEARVVVAGVETFLKHAEAIGLSTESLQNLAEADEKK